MHNVADSADVVCFIRPAMHNGTVAALERFFGVSQICANLFFRSDEQGRTESSQQLNHGNAIDRGLAIVV